MPEDSVSSVSEVQCGHCVAHIEIPADQQEAFGQGEEIGVQCPACKYLSFYENKELVATLSPRQDICWGRKSPLG